MKGNSVLQSFIPEHRMKEGTISGTPKPGVMMERVASTEDLQGRPTYRVYQPGTGDGAPAQLLLLLEDHLQGKTWDDAYVSGTRCFVAQLDSGDEVNVRKADISGTSSATEDLNIGEELLIVDGTGKVSPVAVGIANASVTYPFRSRETVTDQPAEILVFVEVK